ncbi:MAG: hypothetical protein C0625_09260 [Arcobacter sp.]|nr:MAG: hypothetical protein C0625_09260 [Arcobacter sp.]
MSNNLKVRKLPKKTLIIISIMALMCIVGFIFIQQTKSMKMEEILNTLGHKNIKNVKVINKLSVEDKETKITSTVYKIVFDDIDLKKECIGFVHRSNRGKYSKDLDCK